MKNRAQTCPWTHRVEQRIHRQSELPGGCYGGVRDRFHAIGVQHSVFDQPDACFRVGRDVEKPSSRVSVSLR